MPKVTEIAAGLAAPIVEACGCTLWDVEYVKEAGEHFARFRGEPVDVRLYRAREGRKELTGTLKGYDDGDVTVELDGTDTLLEKKDVAQVRLHVTF